MADDLFSAALKDVRALRVRPELKIEELPAPLRLAENSFAIGATLASANPEDEENSFSQEFFGRLILLHDPEGVPDWGGIFRIVIYVRVPIESELMNDELLHEIGWAWLEESLLANSAAFQNKAGTVTKTASKSFDSLSSRNDEQLVEIRASWTPIIESGQTSYRIQNHVSAWLGLLSIAGGLTPIATPQLMLIGKKVGNGDQT